VRSATSRSGFTLIEIMIALAIIGIIMAIAAPSYKRYEEYALTRACFANQKTISGALANFNLDTSQKRTDIPQVFATLQAAGYLQVAPDDPGQGGSTTQSDYQFTYAGFGVKCTVHGTLQ